MLLNLPKKKQSEALFWAEAAREFDITCSFPTIVSQMSPEMLHCSGTPRRKQAEEGVSVGGTAGHLFPREWSEFRSVDVDECVEAVTKAGSVSI